MAEDVTNKSKINMKFYKHFLVYRGKHHSVYFHAETASSSKVYDYFEQCDDVTQANLLYLTKRMADIGRIYDKTKFRLEDKRNKIYAFKPKGERFFCFFSHKKEIIITSAYRKKKQKVDIKELNKAIEIRSQYITKK